MMSATVTRILAGTSDNYLLTFSCSPFHHVRAFVLASVLFPFAVKFLFVPVEPSLAEHDEQQTETFELGLGKRPMSSIFSSHRDCESAQSKKLNALSFLSSALRCALGFSPASVRVWGTINNDKAKEILISCWP